jgi:hypothetical protein
MGKRGNHGAKVSNPLEFDGIRMKAGVNSFILTPRPWIERTGDVTRHGRGSSAR